MTRQQLILSRILLVLYLAALCMLCFGNFSNAPKVQPSFFGIPTDKIVHFLMFFPFPILVYFAFNRYGGKRLWQLLGVLITFLTGAGMAIGTELIQGLITYRSKDVRDFRADCIALAAASIIILLFVLLRRSRK